MNRRNLLLSGAAGVLGVGVTGAVASHKLFAARDDGRGKYAEDHRVVYDHEDLRLQASQDAVHPGEAIEFEVTNTADSRGSVGCNVPWAIERRADGEWRTVTWTGDDYYDLCATVLLPGKSRTEHVTLSTDALERRTDEVRGELQTGKYRFALLGPSPFLAVDFELLPARE